MPKMPKKKKAKSKKVKRAKNGQIQKGSQSNGGGRPKGAKSTGKKPANKTKTNLSAKGSKPAGSSKKQNKKGFQKATSKTKRNTSGVKRNAKGQLLKGTKSISPGRRAGTCRADELDRAIAQAESVKGKGSDWLVDLILRSWNDSQLSVAILSRKFPALKAVEITTNPQSAYDKQETAKIRRKIAKRFEPVPEELRNLRRENAKLKYEAEQRTKES